MTKPSAPQSLSETPQPQSLTAQYTATIKDFIDGLWKSVFVCHGDLWQLPTISISSSRKIGGVMGSSSRFEQLKEHNYVSRSTFEAITIIVEDILILQYRISRGSASSWVALRLVRYISCLLHLTPSTFLNTPAATLLGAWKKMHSPTKFWRQDLF